MRSKKKRNTRISLELKIANLACNFFRKHLRRRPQQKIGPKENQTNWQALLITARWDWPLMIAQQQPKENQKTSNNMIWASENPNWKIWRGRTLNKKVQNGTGWRVSSITSWKKSNQQHMTSCWPRSRAKKLSSGSAMRWSRRKRKIICSIWETSKCQG